MGGFNSAISLLAGGLPIGATSSFNPTSIAAPGAGSSTLTINTSSTTPPGTYTVTVTGTGGKPRAPTNLFLALTAAGGGGSAEIMTNAGLQTAPSRCHPAPACASTPTSTG